MRMRKSLGGWVLRYTLFINSALLIVLGVVLTGLSGNTLQEELVSAMDRVLTQTNSVLDTYLIDMRSRLVKLASQRSVIACLSGPRPSYAESLPYERDMDDRLSGIDLFNPIEDVLVLGDNGYVYNLNMRKNLLADYDFTACDWYRQAVRVENGIHVQMLGLHDQLYYNPITEPKARERQSFSLSMAVSHPTSYKIIGAIVCNMDTQKLGQLLQQGNYEEEGCIALVNREGVVCAQSEGEVGDVLPFTLPTGTSGHFTETVDGETYLVCNCASEFSGWQLMFYIPLSRIRSHARPLWGALAMVLLVCLVLNTVAALLYMRSIRRPVARLTQSLSLVDANNISPIPVREEYVELALISRKFNELLEHIDELIRKDYRTQIELSQSQLAALRGQINPHFLFNTLQLLQTEIIYGNVEKSNSIIISLSQLLRYYMTNNEARVTVARELDYLKKYLTLFEGKYEGRLKTEIRIQPDAARLAVPKLLLQPIVENSIRHAVDMSPDSVTISIEASVREGTLLLTVVDDGGGIAPERLEAVQRELEKPVDWLDHNIGLSNVHQRIRTSYGPQYGLSIDSYDGKTIVTLCLPAEEEFSS